MELMALRCAGCGANLEVDEDVDNLTCSYCKTPQEVVRRGGTVALKKLGDAISRVQRGTDKTAAELAIPRIQRELLELEASRLRQLEAPVRVKPRTRLSNAVIGMAVGFAILFFVMIGMAGDGMDKSILIRIVWLFWWACLIGSVGGYVYLRFARGSDLAKAKALRHAAINEECKQQERTLRQQLDKARAVVNEH